MLRITPSSTLFPYTTLFRSRLLSCGNELVVKRFDIGLVLNGHQRGHVKSGAQMAVADFGDASWPMDRCPRLIGTRIEPGMRHPLRRSEIDQKHQHFRQ